MPRKTMLLYMCLAILGVIFGRSPASYAQSPRQDRISGPIAGSPAVWLEGNRRPMFQPNNDQGPVADSFRMDNITLMFKPTESQQTALSELLAQQQDRSSPNYHRWLTPEEYADRFGVTSNDMEKVVTWLTAQGLR